MTTLTARTREVIRAALLARLSARFVAGLAPLDVREPGDAWQMTDALAVLLSALEAQAASAPSQILPDRATGTWADAHGTAEGLPRQTGERDADYQTRLLAWWSYRLPTGSPASQVAVCEATDDCEEAYAYPCMGSGAVRGLCDVRVMGPAQGGSATNTRILDNAQLANVRDYIDGTVDAHGLPVVDGEQQRPVCAQMSATGNVLIYSPTPDPRDVTLSITNAPTHPWPWVGSHAIVASTSVSWTVSGDHSDLVDLPWLVPVATTVARGGYVRAVPTSATYNGGTNRTKFDVASGILPGVPLLTTGYPAPPNFEQVRDAIFAVFDALTPGDTTPTPSRYPAPTGARPAKLYLGALYAAAAEADGVSDVTITAPAATVTPAAYGLITLGTLTITRTP